jgi:hypothetical protein
LLLPMVKAVRESEEALMLVYCAYTLNEQPNVPQTHLEYKLIRFHFSTLICFLIIYAKPHIGQYLFHFKYIKISKYSFHKVNPFSDNFLLVKFTYPIWRSGRFSLGIYMIIKFLTVPLAKIIFTGEHKYTKRDSITT